ncbi:MAG: zinc-binding dehydrogenase [bacterium]|nr:zinc-binding dehydrogenase [bacterium]
MLKLMALKPFSRHLPRGRTQMPSMAEAMAVLKELLEAGKLTPVIDRAYPLEQVPEAMRYLQSGRARGKIIITP